MKEESTYTPQEVAAFIRDYTEAIYLLNGELPSGVNGMKKSKIEKILTSKWEGIPWEIRTALREMCMFKEVNRGSSIKQKFPDIGAQISNKIRALYTPQSSRTSWSDI